MIELVLGQMYGKIAGKSIQDADYSAKLNERNNLLRYFQKAKRHLGHLEKEKGNSMMNWKNLMPCLLA